MYNVALIGIGNIGLLFDKDPKASTSLSHAKGIYLNKEFDLKYAADTSDENLSNLKHLFPNVTYKKDYKQLLTCKDIDILVIATPTKTHNSILMAFEKCENIRYFFMEKPLFYTKEEYEKIPLHVKEKIIVNYPRRFEPNFQKIKAAIQKNNYGTLKKSIINYSKGFSNNGSHAIDFLNFLLDNFSLKEFNILDKTVGFNNDDPTYDVFGKIETLNSISPFYFIGFNHEHLTTFSVELFFEKAILKYDDTKGTITLKNIEADPLYPEYLTATKPIWEKKIMMDKIMLLAYDDLSNRLSNKTSFACNFEEELNNTKFKNKILRK